MFEKLFDLLSVVLVNFAAEYIHAISCGGLFHICLSKMRFFLSIELVKVSGCKIKHGFMLSEKHEVF